jgi:group I intron endonuclease
MCEVTKVCKKCKSKKTLESFKSKYRNKDGYASICIVCAGIILGIYKITSPSGRLYIGQSSDLSRRFAEYKKLQNCKPQTKLFSSFLKYGTENHTFEIIEECLEEDLNCKERFWQNYYDVLNGGLNCVLQECGEVKAVLSEETRRKRGSKGEKNFFYGKSGELSPWYGIKGESNPNYGRESWNKGKELHHLRGGE